MTFVLWPLYVLGFWSSVYVCVSIFSNKTKKKKKKKYFKIPLRKSKRAASVNRYLKLSLHFHFETRPG